MASLDAVNTGSKGLRVRLSCDACAASKLRCNRERPSCERCRVQAMPCSYSLSRKQRKSALYAAELEQQKNILDTQTTVTISSPEAQQLIESSAAELANADFEMQQPTPDVLATFPFQQDPFLDLSLDVQTPSVIQLNDQQKVFRQATKSIGSGLERQASIETMSSSLSKTRSVCTTMDDQINPNSCHQVAYRALSSLQWPILTLYKVIKVYYLRYKRIPPYTSLPLVLCSPPP